LLDKFQFRDPQANLLGDMARNALHGPGFWNLDFSVARSLELRWPSDMARLQIRAEVFNIFNHTNLSNPETLLECQQQNQSCFGQALFGRQGFGSALPSASPLSEQPRRIQFGFKFLF